MTEVEIKLVIASLLHDIGKVIYREGSDKRKHSESGYDYLKQEVGITDKEILNGVLYHHYDKMVNAKLDKQSLAYITYIADNIASAADRRKSDAEGTGFETSMPLQSVFNILNGNEEQYYYKPRLLDCRDEINYPQPIAEPFDKHFYYQVKDNLTDNLRGLEWNETYINSLLTVLEGNLTYVPSSTNKSELADISLYDHVKITAAIAACIYQYLQEQQIEDYRDVLFQNANEFYKKETMMLASLDISGIQDFIYTIARQKALKSLRTRSFYLEIMMEHIIDCFMQRLNLSRTNLIYSGGGHCYILVPNTKKAKKTLDDVANEVNVWLLDMFDISLYVAVAYYPCNSNALRNQPEGSYADIFKELSAQLAKKKRMRYTAKQIIRLNQKKKSKYALECKVCKKIDDVSDEGMCQFCEAVTLFSNHILKADIFTVVSKEEAGSLPLPLGGYLLSDTEKTLKERMNKPEYVRAYSKNALYTGKQMTTKLWVGDYSYASQFDDLVEQSNGIKRLGVLRADVDNLGQAIVSGFDNPKNDNRYVTLSRTATLSRQLSLFFKMLINRIMKYPKYTIGTPKKERFATIVYSGGDDLFIVGAWDDIIELAVDISREFSKYTQGTLTISAGVGVYVNGYPISVMAGEVAELEDESKHNVNKNSITLLPDGVKHAITTMNTEITISDGTYTWKEFTEEVIDEKYRLLENFFRQEEDRGKAFIYRILEFIRGREEKINFARFVYLLSRLEPDRSESEEAWNHYHAFAQQMIEWIKNERACRQLKTAINLYIYRIREQEDEGK